MSSSRPAYLVVHKIALFNDEWYDDLTLQVNVANPADLFSTRAEAEAYVLTQTRELMRGHSFDDLEMNEDEEYALTEALALPGTFDPEVSRSLEMFLEKRSRPLPTSLTDAQLDAILTASGLEMFHILEAEASDFEVALAQSTLALTPERPFVGLEFNYDEEHEDDEDYRPEELIEDIDDPAAARLNRVTELFGRKYATGIMI